MALLPQLNVRNQQQMITYEFKGYNHNPIIQDGEMSEMKNLSGDRYPILSQRPERSQHLVIAQDDYEDIQIIDFFKIRNENGGFTDFVLYAARSTDDNTLRVLYSNGTASWYLFTIGESVEDAKICYAISGVFLYISYRTSYIDSEEGQQVHYIHGREHMKIDLITGTQYRDSFYQHGSIHNITPCEENGSSTYDYTGEQPPENPREGMIWRKVIEKQGTKINLYELRVYRNEYWEWYDSEYTSVLVNLDGNHEVGESIQIYGLNFNGIQSQAGKQELSTINNKPFVIAKRSPFYMTQYNIVIPRKAHYGCLNQEAMGNGRYCSYAPEVDYLTAYANRIWGCKYGWVESSGLVNEIRCTELGEPLSWNKFEGTNNDSWVASIGSEGPFTGCCLYDSGIIFFKEGCLHKVSGSMPNQFAITEQKCRGVEAGSGRSVKVVNEKVYYKGLNEVMCYDGTLPYSISDALGDKTYHNGIGGMFRDDYYLSMTDENNNRNLFIYNTKRGLWHKQDDIDVAAFTDTQETIYASCGNNITDMLGKSGVSLGAFDWSATFGQSGYEFFGGMGSVYNLPNQAYLSRFNIRMRMEPGSTMRMWLEYDSDGEWHDEGEITGRSLTTFMIPVVPRRCDHCRLKLTGHGRVEIYSIARIYEAGGDGAAYRTGGRYGLHS